MAKISGSCAATNPRPIAKDNRAPNAAGSSTKSTVKAQLHVPAGIFSALPASDDAAREMVAHSRGNATQSTGLGVGTANALRFSPLAKQDLKRLEWDLTFGADDIVHTARTARIATRVRTHAERGYVEITVLTKEEGSKLIALAEAGGILQQFKLKRDDDGNLTYNGTKVVFTVGVYGVELAEPQPPPYL